MNFPRAAGYCRLLLVGMLVASPALAQEAGHGSSLASDPPAQTRLTPTEYLALPTVADRVGTAAGPALESRILKGDPSKLGLYTILLKVPANTRVEPHVHPDERVATVISGTWFYGYGDKFDAKALKELPPGSFYTEPASMPHFAQTGNQPAVIQITGIGPSGTQFVKPERKAAGDR